ncbi:SDR family oxidoreductase [Limnoglobus roseus]|uniref:Uncharacterized protein n=1 Tax=Limnoglobus roseus TaxID=2598579 RepID=A0A5C1AN65_9BACT|nr:SDR family oxidoreductase [Limnoglobus roseus]QEL18358.1 hypothetical protein PX52LOC_05381 [Limnoglobus roseus]
MATPQLRLDILPGTDASTGIAVTWVLARRGDRVVVASRWLDRLPALAAALQDEKRMARFQPVDAVTRRWFDRLPATSRVDVVVHEAERPASRILSTLPKRTWSTTRVLSPHILP